MIPFPFQSGGLGLARYTGPGTDYVAAVMALNPLAYWRFNEASGTSAADNSGNGNTATFTSSPAPSFGQTGIVLGTADTCELNATGVYATVPVGVMTLATSTSEKTIIGWIQSTTTAESAMLMSGRQTGGNGILNFGYGSNGVNNANTGTLSILVRGDNGVGLTTVNVTTPKARDGAIHMVAARIKSDKSIQIFQDGVIRATGTHTMTSGVTPASGNARIFSDALNGSLPNFVGYSGHFAVWNSALSDADISNLYAIGS